MKRGILLLIIISILISFIRCKDKDQSTPPPDEQNFIWQPTGLSNGSVIALVVNNNGIVFASVDGDGIYKSTDNGISWAKIKNGPFQSAGGSGYADCFCADGSNLWVGTDGAGIHRSNDEGLTWIEVNDGESTGHIFAIKIRNDESGGGTLFCGTENGIFKLNEQSGWNKVESNWTNALLMLYEGYPGQCIYGGGPYQPVGSETPGILLWSSNNGSLWYRTAIPGKINAMAKNSQDEIFIATNGAGVLKNSFFHRWYSWETISIGIEGAEYYYFTTIIVSPNDHIFVGGTTGVFLSTNNGDKWTRIVDGLTNQTVNELAINPSGLI